MCIISGCDNVSVDEPMYKHTTFRVGGKADYYVMPQNIKEVSMLISFLKKSNLPYYILGNGSNVLVSDDGYRGVVIRIYKNISDITIDQTKIKASAGALLSNVSIAACNAGLRNFEFAAGIPGTVGGAVVMNAGAYGGEIKQVLIDATVLDENGNRFILSNDELKLGYRTSIITKKGYTVLEATIQLEKGNISEIKKVMDDFRQRRIDKQPLEYPSAGSTFKRPEGFFAGKLIMDAGLKGYQLGGAQISDKHCGFIINKGNATAADILKLIQYTQSKVFEQFEVKLETEVKMLGRF
ncbi:UDP-N-acetylenolpyruvoylglucosamine reductase [Lachnotalea glycerini]|nr:UDP-N-acetylenolpyruvoylglucosamine reductase [Lachnotalea glycerini]RDY29852.1 UDP-N-acetylmuramate dehydrogenase [Lachnotalea glycerini]